MGAEAERPHTRPEARPEARPGIGRLQWVLAVGAPAAAVPGLLHGLDSHYGGFFVLTVVPLALPPLLGRFPKVFAQACVVIALALVSWSVIGAVIAMYVFLPSAALLLLAAAPGPAGRLRSGAYPAVKAPPVR
ncbi:hypothetical protein [Actinacidiphila glaucinigra]|uniref:hypothetical protein n=1 Tax=Actinacidiphila glaucinigra TaxID=235986 RepID=UPI002E320F12|nr:hypothetical protein [Actinacidiphila glaucinigra]